MANPHPHPHPASPETTHCPAVPGVRTLQYREGRGWSGPLPSELDGEDTLAVAFGAPRFGEGDRAIEELRRALPRCALVGCSTAGEIFGEEIHDRSVSVGVLALRESRLRRASALVRHADDSRHAGRLLGEQLRGEGLRAVLVLSPGHHVNGSELVRGMGEVLDPGIAITGGLAGDGTEFKSTWLLRDGAPTGDFVVAVGLVGDRVRTGHGCAGGWDAFGPERTITKSSGNTLFELDGKAALDLYKTYLGARAKELPSSALLFPLAIRPGEGSDRIMVRTILSVDESARSMTFAGDIPEGWSAQLMRTNFDRLVTASGHSAESAAGLLGPRRSAALCVAISCVGRRMVLGERTEEELEALGHSVRAGDGVVGFYSYGEISPLRQNVACDLQNQSMTISMFGEE